MLINKISPMGKGVAIGGKMLYNEFKNYVKDRVEEKLGDDVKIEIRQIKRNNSTIYDGLLFVSEGINVSPTIYLNFFYKQYLNGTNQDIIVNNIVKTYNSCVLSEGINLSFFTEFDFAKDHIVYKLINYEKNIELLKEIPHIRFLDLAIVFYYLINKSEQENATILIYNSHLEMWGTDLETLHKHARENTPRLLPPMICNLNDIIREAIDDLEIYPGEVSPMYIITNRSKRNGAATILYDNVLRNFARKTMGDMYIIPSSINEVLVISAKYVTDRKELDLLVEEVNEAAVSKEEVLSDHVYYYSLLEDIIN